MEENMIFQRYGDQSLQSLFEKVMGHVDITVVISTANEPHSWSTISNSIIGG
jgi:hypothetical protein